MSSSAIAQKNLKKRDSIWPDATTVTAKAQRSGWAKMSRILPLLFRALERADIGANTGTGHVYLELLSRDWGEAFVEIKNIEDHAFCAGYQSGRARRTWLEQLDVLKTAGLIRIDTIPGATRILMIDPERALIFLRKEGKVSDPLWNSINDRLIEVTGKNLSDPCEQPLRVAKSDPSDDVKPSAPARGKRGQSA